MACFVVVVVWSKRFTTFLCWLDSWSNNFSYMSICCLGLLYKCQIKFLNTNQMGPIPHIAAKNFLQSIHLEIWYCPLDWRPHHKRWESWSGTYMYIYPTYIGTPEFRTYISRNMTSTYHYHLITDVLHNVTFVPALSLHVMLWGKMSMGPFWAPHCVLCLHCQGPL